VLRLKDGALQALLHGALRAELGVEVRRRRRAPRLGRDVDGDRLPAGAGAVAAEQRPALAVRTTTGPPAAAVTLIAAIYRRGAGANAPRVVLLLLLPGRGQVSGREQAGPAVPAGLRRRDGAAALAGHVRHRWDGQPRRQAVVVIVIRERERGRGRRRDHGGVAPADVGRAEVALGREDADLGAAGPAPRRRRRRRAEVDAGAGGGEADRPRRRDPVPVHAVRLRALSRSFVPQ